MGRGLTAMAECVNFSKCRFFVENMKNSPSTSAMIQNNYCRGKFQECARNMIFEKLGESHVPSDLSPSESERVAEILKSS
jgi:hypothetical protein